MPRSNCRPLTGQCRVTSWFRSDFLKAGTRRWYKKQTPRKMRRLVRHDPETAPRKYRYVGWVD